MNKQINSFLRFINEPVTTQQINALINEPTGSHFAHTHPVMDLLLVQHLLERCFVAEIILPLNPPSC